MKSVALLTLALKYEQDIVSARQKTRALSALLGFEAQDQVRLATAVSELSRNAFQYSGGGKIDVAFELPRKLIITISDKGSGIANLKEILDGHYVSKTGMGVGLLGSKKLMDEFEIRSSPEEGTSITIAKFLPIDHTLTSKTLDLAMQDFVNKKAGTAFEEIQNQNQELLLALEELRVTKEELTAMNTELAETNRGVVALYADLDEKAASLQKANEIKTSFLSNMTHEFRTPLSSIISLTRILQERIDGELTSEQEIQVGLIAKSAHSLLELVNDLLDLAKVEAGRVEIQASEFSLEEMLGGIRGVFRPLVRPDSPVSIRIESPAEDVLLETDQGKIAQILRNLFSNALKFTESGEVSLTTTVDERNIKFAVTDTGIGIANEHLDFIFEDFTQLKSNAQGKHKGTGLGLPLSRKLASLLGGELTVKSKFGQGSVFELVVPRQYLGESTGELFTSAKKSEKTQEEASSAFKVLVIDDDEASRYVLRTLLVRDLEVNLKEASIGLGAFATVRTWKPDLIFTDLSSGDKDGLELISAIRRDHFSNDIPIIVSTSKLLSDEIVDRLKKERIGILSKQTLASSDGKLGLRHALKSAGFDYLEDKNEH